MTAKPLVTPVGMMEVCRMCFSFSCVILVTESVSSSVEYHHLLVLAEVHNK
jgi:hypothetical protein